MGLVQPRCRWRQALQCSKLPAILAAFYLSTLASASYTIPQKHGHQLSAIPPCLKIKYPWCRCTLDQSTSMLWTYISISIADTSLGIYSALSSCSLSYWLMIHCMNLTIASVASTAWYFHYWHHFPWLIPPHFCSCWLQLWIVLVLNISGTVKAIICCARRRSTHQHDFDGSATCDLKT